jgi:hypothetical protein
MKIGTTALYKKFSSQREFHDIQPSDTDALHKGKKKQKKQPHTGQDRPLGFQEVEAPRFLDNRHIKVVRLSALRTGRLYPTGKISGTHSC